MTRTCGSKHAFVEAAISYAATDTAASWISIRCFQEQHHDILAPAELASQAGLHVRRRAQVLGTGGDAQAQTKPACMGAWAREPLV